MSEFGFGAAPLGNFRRTLSEEECDATLARAWELGVRYFDTAPLYGFGLSELRVGRLLQTKSSDEYTLSSKVGRLLEPCPPEEADGIIFENIPPFKFVYDYSYDGVMRSYEESLQRLGVDRINILYVHDIDAFNHGGRNEAIARARELMDDGGWRALSELRDSGAIDAVGIGVNEWEPCSLMLELADPDLFLLAGRYTLLEQEPVDTLFPECERRGVKIVIGGPYNSGILVGRSTYNYFQDIPDNIRHKVRALDDICREHGVAMGAAALQFVLAHPLVVSVIPGSQTLQELETNLSFVGADIPDAFWRDLRAANLIAENAPTPAN
ncbi:aldo/keto reductase [Hyphococcus luteus]|nr:aldo/keto reductase [Marinicaulis flavus]